MKSPKLSVIIPVYNVDSFLSQCLISIQNQTFTDFEVICVDDHSPDNSASIIKRFSDNDSRFKYLKPLKWGGQSKARNFGIDNSKGKYLTFVDGDDILEPYAFEYMLTNLEANNGDVVCSEYYEYYDNGNNNNINDNDKLKSMFASRHPKKETTISGLEALNWLLRFKIDHSSCTKLYSRASIGDIRFPKGDFNEDANFLFYIFQQVNMVVCLPKPTYIYRHTSNSTTRNFKPSHFGILKNIDEMREYDNRNGNKFKEDIDVWCNIYTANLFMTMKRFKQGKYYPSEYSFLKKNLRNNFFNILFGKDYPYKTKIKALLSFFSI